MLEEVSDWVSLCKDLEALNQSIVSRNALPGWQGKSAHAMEGVLRTVPSACIHLKD